MIVLKTSIVSLAMSEDHTDGKKTIRFFFYLNNETFLYLSLALLEHEANKQVFNFKCIRRWPVINLVTLIYRY